MEAAVPSRERNKESPPTAGGGQPLWKCRLPVFALLRVAEPVSPGVVVRSVTTLTVCGRKLNLPPDFTYDSRVSSHGCVTLSDKRKVLVTARIERPRIQPHASRQRMQLRKAGAARSASRRTACPPTVKGGRWKDRDDRIAPLWRSRDKDAAAVAAIRAHGSRSAKVCLALQPTGAAVLHRPEDDAVRAS
jgi:hypothetical protein